MKSIENLINIFLSDIGWETVYSLSIEQNYDTNHLLEAFINIEDWKITFRLPGKFLNRFMSCITNVELEILLEEVTKYRNDSVHSDNPNFKFLYFLLAEIAYHEYGHSNECPHDRLNFSLIIQAISTALEHKNRFKNENILYYIANLFTDTIVNFTYGLQEENSFYRNGFFIFYYYELTKGNVDLGFLFFLLSNYYTFFRQNSMKEHFDSIILPLMGEEYEEGLKKIISIFCPFEEIVDDILLGVTLYDEERWKIINYLSNKSNWTKMAYNYTLELIQHIPKDKSIQQTPVPDSYFTNSLREDDLFKEQILDDILSNKFLIRPHSNDSEQKSGKTIIQPRSIASKAPEQGKEGQGEGKQTGFQENTNYPEESNFTSGLSLFPHLTVLDGLYRYRSKNIKIKIKEEEDGRKFPLGYMKREMMDKNDTLTNFDPMYTYFLPNSEELLLFKKSLPILHNDSGIIRHKTFPNLAVLCDDSGSMDWRPETGDGKYDTVIITIYSLFQWLRKQQFAPVIKYNFTCFSTTTRTTGWVDYYGIDKFLPLLFNYEGGGTKINEETLSTILTKNEHQIIILITDGHIQNSKQVKKLLNKNKHSILFLLIQVGELSEFAVKVKESGFLVQQIHDIQELPVIVLNFVEASYSSV